MTSLTDATLPCQMQLCFLAHLENANALGEWSSESDKSEDKESKCAGVQQCRVCVQINKGRQREREQHRDRESDREIDRQRDTEIESDMVTTTTMTSRENK